MKSSTLLLIFGGRSAEHEISLRSATEVAHAVDRSRFRVLGLGLTRNGDFRQARSPNDSPAQIVDHGESIPDLASFLRQADVALPILHGPYGEDGCFQGLLEVFGLPYVGSGVLASALCMDKAVFKRYLAAQAPTIPQLPWIEVHREHVTETTTLVQRVDRELGYPCFVKPANQGSSIGVHKVKRAEDLAPAIADALRFDPVLVIERGLEHPRELEVAVLGNGDTATLVSPVGEIGLPAGTWYDYDTKYINDHATLHLPAQLEPALATALQHHAKLAFRATGCAGLARIDFLVDRASQAIYLNEINTLPGFTSISMYPKLMELTGISYTALITRLCDLALERARQRQGLALVR